MNFTSRPRRHSHTAAVATSHKIPHRGALTSAGHLICICVETHCHTSTPLSKRSPTLTLPPASRTAIAAEALGVSLEIANEWWRDRAVRALMPLLAEGERATALAALRALPTVGTRARSLARAAGALPAGQAAALAAEALALSEGLSPASAAQVALWAVGRLPAGLRAAAAEAAMPGAALLPDPGERGGTLAELAAHLPEAQRLEALHLIRAIEDPGMRSSALAAIARWLPEHVDDTVLDEAVSVAHTIAPAEGRARALANIAGALGPAQQEQVAQAALATAAVAGDDLLWGRVLLWTGALLPAGALAGALPRARRLSTPEARAVALPALATRLPEPLRAEAVDGALAAVARVADEWARVAALNILAPHLPEPAAPVAWGLAEALADPWARADALSALAAHLPAAQQAHAFAAALAAARANANPWPRARALTTVAEQLPD